MECTKSITVYNSGHELARNVYDATNMLNNLEVDYGLKDYRKDIVAVYNDGLELVRL